MRIDWKLSSLRPGVAALLALALVGFQACSFSTSSDSSSDSSASSSESSGSSSPGSKEAQYKNDVREYTAAYVKTGGQFDAFQRGIGDLAKKHGITNWEDSTLTYEGIGEGLGEARASEVQLKAYADGLAGQNAAKRAAMEKGYSAKKG
ncbi:MAG TPA: putative lipoprotein [Candidatus Bathyarchaeia archaeon]|nr:putative lipoprotein [Candidatus Bathyarchaeia archaeon]